MTLQDDRSPIQKRTLPLHIHTATLFIILTIALGAGQIWFNYQKNTELISDGSAVIYEKIMQKVYSDLKSKYAVAATSVEIIAQGNLVTAKTLEERLAHLPVLTTILKADQAVSGFEVGYANGDFFIIRPMYSQYMRKQFKAPDNTLYAADNIQAFADGTKEAIRIYYDQSLREIARETLPETTYDPRVRPWYKLALASDSYATTPAYLYYFVKKVGITITKEAKVPGVVVAADFALDDISKVLKGNAITPSAELVLLDRESQVIAYKTPDKLVVEDALGRNRIATIRDLDSRVLWSQFDTIRPKKSDLNFEFDGEDWGGVVREIDVSSDFKLFFAFIAPDSELFAEAINIRWQSSLIALALIIIALPITAYSAYRISSPLRELTLKTHKIRQFDFSPEATSNSAIHEIHTLATDMDAMKNTISHFLNMIKSLAGEKNLDSLLETITKQTLEISGADATVLYLLNEAGDKLEPASAKVVNQHKSDIQVLSFDMNSKNNFIVKSITGEVSEIHQFNRYTHGEYSELQPFFNSFDNHNLQVLTLPLKNRSGEATGVLCVINDSDNEQTEDVNQHDKIGFMQALSGFAAVSMESKYLQKNQKDLMASFIKLIAGAIDAKSAYTGGHCLRVPELTKMLAKEACDIRGGEFKDFSLSIEEWEELEIAAWLHDCGKITTPEFVVDKATKLETIYDRIHEVRMRFEVLKRDATIEFLEKKLAGPEVNAAALHSQLLNTLEKIDRDFAFVAQCNIGSENMSQDDVQRLEQIADITWQRTIDDRLGVSWEEALRKDKADEQFLPATEKLLANKIEHIIERDPSDILPADNKWGFDMQTPEHLYDRGELYNLSIPRGTLNNEERYKVNEHIMQTIIMLDALNFPKNLSNVMDIAGGHHEKMDGTGYPKRLKREEMPIAARMMAIADIFEALTASDRPYKKAKKLSEAIRIMSFMKKDQHIDGPLFELFLSSGVYLTYAEQYLSADQIDFVDISAYISTDEMSKKAQPLASSPSA